jgi:hypothetical protein
MAPPWGSDHATIEPRLDRHARCSFLPLDLGRRRVLLIRAPGASMVALVEQSVEGLEHMCLVLLAD